MKKISILCLLLLSALTLLVGCKADPEAFNNIPTLRLGEPTDLLRTSVTLHGSLQTNYPGHIREYGFLFSSSIDFTSSDTQTIPVTEGSMADITASVSGLTIGETYFYALYATTGGEKMLSEVASVAMPTRSGATLSEVEVLDLYTPTLKARITDDGGSIITSVGFCWSTSPNPTIFTGEHEFATYDEESQSFTADLTKLKGRENYYVCAFAECDLTGGGDVSISYGETVELKLKFKPTVSLKEVAATAASLTFEITSTDAEEVRWMLLPESSLDLYEEVTAEIVLGSENKVEPNKTEEITVDDLEPETTYTIYAAAEKEGVKVLGEKLEMATTAVPSVTTKATAQHVTSLEFTVSTLNAEKAAWVILSPAELSSYGTVTAEKVLTSKNTIETNKEVAVTVEELTPETTYTIYAAAEKEGVRVLSEKLEMATDLILETWKIYYTSTDGNVVEPYKVTNFGANILSNTYENEQGVIIFDGEVTSIGNNAFNGCSGLISITIPDSVTSIGGNAFYGCSGLTSIDIPDSVTSIEFAAFSNCTGLTSIIIPDSVTSIEGRAFRDCTGLTSVTIPDSVTSIGWEAFSGCTSLTSITIPDSVTSIENEAFSECSSLTSVTIGNGVTSIGYEAFYYCTGLTSITIPDSVTSIGESAFQNCTGLTSIAIPDSVTSIESSAFSGCKGLTSIAIGNGVTEIGESAFWACTGLTKVEISDLAAWCKIDFSTDESNPLYHAEKLYLNGSLVTDLEIPDSVTSIGGNAFYGCSGLTSVTIPDSVTSIGERAFDACTGLTSVTIPDSVTSIGNYAFYYCTSLTSVYCKPTTPPTGNWFMFSLNASNRKIYVPAESLEAYMSAEGWSSYASDIVGYDF